MSATIDVSTSSVSHGDALAFLERLPDGCADVVYADPPFNTGVDRSDPRNAGVRYDDDMERALWINLMENVAAEARRVLTPSGSFYLHLDWRGVHDAKAFAVDEQFGRDNQLGEIVWSYDWGARQKDRFSRKHDTILHYAKSAGKHRFDNERVDRVPYLAPELQMYRSKRLGKDDGAERIARGKPVTDVFQDINVVGTNSKERELNSYPTMKPVALVRRLLAPVVVPGSLVVDPFCGSGTTAEAAVQLGCRFAVNDASEQAVAVTAARAERLGATFSRSSSVRCFNQDV